MWRALKGSSSMHGVRGVKFDASGSEQKAYTDELSLFEIPLSYVLPLSFSSLYISFFTTLELEEIGWYRRWFEEVRNSR